MRIVNPKIQKEQNLLTQDTNHAVAWAMLNQNKKCNNQKISDRDENTEKELCHYRGILRYYIVSYFYGWLFL